MNRHRVIFICTHNSARSQMAEGMLRAWGGEAFDACSAGLEPGEVRPEAIKVMAEIGIDISGHESKSIDRFLQEPFSWVITVCDAARQRCPTFPGADRSAHWAVDDPSEVHGDEALRLEAFRRARDELRGRMQMFILAASREDLPQPAEEMLRPAP